MSTHTYKCTIFKILAVMHSPLQTLKEVSCVWKTCFYGEKALSKVEGLKTRDKTQQHISIQKGFKFSTKRKEEGLYGHVCPAQIHGLFDDRGQIKEKMKFKHIPPGK